MMWLLNRSRQKPCGIGCAVGSPPQDAGRSRQRSSAVDDCIDLVEVRSGNSENAHRHVVDAIRMERLGQAVLYRTAESGLQHAALIGVFRDVRSAPLADQTR